MAFLRTTFGKTQSSVYSYTFRLSLLRRNREIDRCHSVVSSHRALRSSHSQPQAPLHWTLPNRLNGCGCRAFGVSALRQCKPAVADTGTAAGNASDGTNKRIEVTYDELVDQIETQTVQLFDVRDARELQETGSIPSAVNIPLTKLKGALLVDDVEFLEQYGVPKPARDDTNIVFYGLCSIKGTAALELAHKQGWKKAKHFAGGWQEWSEKYKKNG